MSSSGSIHIEGMKPKMRPFVCFKTLSRDETEEDVKKGVRNVLRRFVIIFDAKNRFVWLVVDSQTRVWKSTITNSIILILKMS
jgi:hypothetical protein